MESQGVKIDIELTDDCRNLRAGMHTVSYVAFSDGTLWCIDKDGETHALQCSEFRFAKVSGFDTRVTQSGRVSIKAGEVWIDLGPLFAGAAAGAQIGPKTDKDPLELLPLPVYPWLDEAV